MRGTFGIYLLDKNNQLLIGHPTNHSLDLWSIPKGIANVGEDTTSEAGQFQIAKREFKEETNLDIDNLNVIEFRYLGMQEYRNKNKYLGAFLVRIEEIDTTILKCTSMVNRKNYSFPEIDAFKVVDLETATKLVHESQRAFIPILMNKVNSVL